MRAKARAKARVKARDWRPRCGAGSGIGTGRHRAIGLRGVTIRRAAYPDREKSGDVTAP